MTDKEIIHELKNFCIFLAGVYQKNFEEFADYNPDKPLLKMNEEEKKYYHSVAERFSTVQGFSQRQFVKKLSEMDYSSKNSIIKVFDYLDNVL